MRPVFRSVYVRVNKSTEMGPFGYDVHLLDSDLDMSRAAAIDHLNAVITDAKKAIELLKNE